MPHQIQHLVNLCVRPAGSGSWRADLARVTAAASPHGDGADEAAGNGTKPYMTLDGGRFCTVGVLTALVKMLTDYVSCVAHLPALGADIVQVEDHYHNSSRDHVEKWLHRGSWAWILRRRSRELGCRGVRAQQSHRLWDVGLAAEADKHGQALDPNLHWQTRVLES